MSDIRDKIAQEITGWDITNDEDTMFVAGRIAELVRHATANGVCLSPTLCRDAADEIERLCAQVRELKVSLYNTNIVNTVLEYKLKRGPTMPENLPHDAFLVMCYHLDGKQWMSVMIAKDFYKSIRNTLKKLEIHQPL